MRAATRLVPVGMMLALAAAATIALRPGSVAVAGADQLQVVRGQQVYQLKCQTCHLASGLGQPHMQIPSLQGVGAAAVDFYISTGRMPEANYSPQARRGPVTVSPADKDALIAFITTTWPG